MSTRKVFERKAAQQETPSPAVSGRLHVAVPSSDHLASVGGGSSSPPDDSHKDVKARKGK